MPLKAKAKTKAKAKAKPVANAAPRPVRKPRPAAAKKKSKPGKSLLQGVVLEALTDMKALDVKVLDVRGQTDIADALVIASGTSDRHVRSVAQRVVEKCKQAGYRPYGVEGQGEGDWVLIDLTELIVHIMLPRVREFYGLDKFWDPSLAKRAARG